MKNGLIRIATFLSVMLISPFFFAPLHAADFKVTGDVRLRAIFSDNADANDTLDDEQQFSDGRFRIKTEISSERATAVATIDLMNDFNDPSGCRSDSETQSGTPVMNTAGTGTTTVPSGAADACGTGSYRLGSNRFGNSYNMVGIREGYIILKLDQGAFAFGRKSFYLGHSLVLNDTADGMAAKFKAGPVETVLASIKVFERTAGSTAGDTDLYILKTRLLEEEGKPVNTFGTGLSSLFVAYLNDRQPTLFPNIDDEATLLAVGLTADVPVGPWVINFEADSMRGKLSNLRLPDFDLTGTNVMLGTRVNLIFFNVGVTGLYTTGDKSAADNERNINGISGNYVLGNILINDNVNSDREGQCPSIGGSRIGFGGRGCLDGAGITALKLDFKLPSFMMVHEVAHSPIEAVLIWAETTEPLTPGGSTDLGFEVDLNWKHQFDDHIFGGVNVGYLLSGDAWKSVIGSADDNQTKLLASLNYTF